MSLVWSSLEEQSKIFLEFASTLSQRNHHQIQKLPRNPRPEDHAGLTLCILWQTLTSTHNTPAPGTRCPLTPQGWIEQVTKNSFWLQTNLCFRQKFPSNCQSSPAGPANPGCLQRKPPSVTGCWTLVAAMPDMWKRPLDTPGTCGHSPVSVLPAQPCPHRAEQMPSTSLLKAKLTQLMMGYSHTWHGWNTGTSGLWHGG